MGWKVGARDMSGGFDESRCQTRSTHAPSLADAILNMKISSVVHALDDLFHVGHAQRLNSFDDNPF